MSTIQERFDRAVRAAKKRIFETISQDCEVFVGASLEHEGVRVPERIKNGDRVAIKFSPRYAYRLEIEEEGVSQILSFGGEDFPVFIAWDAMFVISEERGGRQGTWPFHAPKSLQLKEAVNAQMEDGTMIIIAPDGTVHPAAFLN